MKEMSEQEATDKLEQLVGSIEGCFRLMQTYVECVRAASGNEFTLRKMPSVEERFSKLAQERGYSGEAINHYLNCIR